MTRRWGDAQWHVPTVDVREPERITVRLGFTDGSSWEYPLNACGREVCSVAVNGVDFAPASRHAELESVDLHAEGRESVPDGLFGENTGTYPQNDETGAQERRERPETIGGNDE